MHPPLIPALKPGDAAPDFTAAGSLGGKLHLPSQGFAEKGPVVGYFLPPAPIPALRSGSAYFCPTSPINRQRRRHIVAYPRRSGPVEAILRDPKFCAGKFPHRLGRRHQDRAVFMNLNVTPPLLRQRMVNQTESPTPSSSASPWDRKDGKISRCAVSRRPTAYRRPHVDKSSGDGTCNK